MNQSVNCQAAIFDLDGTLLDTLGDLRDSVNAALLRSGLPRRNTDEIRAFVGNGLRRLIERAVPKNTPEKTVEQCLFDFKEHYRSHSMVLTKPYDGIDALLQKLKANGVRLAVVSNKADHAVKTLVDTFFPNLFDCVFGEREGIPKKPAPDAVLAAMHELHACAEETVYIGDSEVDTETARNAKLPCIAVTWGFRDRQILELQKPARLADSPCELLAMLFNDADTEKGSVSV